MSASHSKSEVTAVIVAAGSGSRLGASLPKALVPLAGVPLVRRAAERIVASEVASRMVVVVPRGEEDPRFDAALASLSLEHVVVPGGERRRDSVAIGVERAVGAELVVVHDAARPLASDDLFRRVVGAAAASGAAVAAVPVADTLVRGDGGQVAELVPREGLFRVQTPQAFRRDLLVHAHEKVDPGWDAPDDGSMVASLGEEVTIVDGEESNVKVTRPGDLPLAAAQLGGDEGSATRVGLGWDVHPLVAGRPFRLVGLEIASESGPKGHSDGDPLGHAIADALLGAAALGDIGSQFPDDDPRFAGIAGDVLLGEVVETLAAAGWRPAQVDAVIVVDRPKIAPHRDEIRERLSRILGIPAGSVSVKGKRTEGVMGISGSAGVACHAIATIVRGERR